MSVKPISFNEAAEKKKAEIPDGVIEVFNDFISKNFNNGKAEILQKKVLSAIALKMHVSKETCLSNGWLDVVETYEAFGWNAITMIQHNKPEGELLFVFTKKGS